MSASRALPVAVRVALGALTVVVLLQAALALAFARRQVGWAMYAFAALLWVLLVVGLARRSRLAWLWARALALVMGAVVTASLVSGLVRHEVGLPLALLGLLGLAVPLFVAGLALGRPAAYPFYDLVCPGCGARTSLAADLLFRKARCRACQEVW